MTALATQAAEYASAMASAYAMDGHPWTVEDALIWSDDAIDLAFRVRCAASPFLTRPSAESWAEAAARLMTGEWQGE